MNYWVQSDGGRTEGSFLEEINSIGDTCYNRKGQSKSKTKVSGKGIGTYLRLDEDRNAKVGKGKWA